MIGRPESSKDVNLSPSLRAFTNNSIQMCDSLQHRELAFEARWLVSSSRHEDGIGKQGLSATHRCENGCTMEMGVGEKIVLLLVL